MNTVILALALTLIMLVILAIIAFRLIPRSEKPAEALTFDWLEPPVIDPAALPLLDNRGSWTLRIEQRRAFRSRLAAWRRDYDRLTFLVKRLLVFSEIDRPDLAKALLQQMVVFRVALMLIEFRLALHVLGIRIEKAAELVELAGDILSDLRDLAATLTFKTICQEVSV